MSENTDDFYEAVGGFKKEEPAQGAQGGGTPNNEGEQPAPVVVAPVVSQEGMPTTKAFFGDTFEIEDWEKVKTEVPTALQLAKEYNEKKQELEDLRIANSNPFVNDQVAQWNEFTKQTGIDNFSTFQYVKGLDLSQAEAIEIMVANEIISNPEFIGDEDIIRARLAREHGVDTGNNDAREIAHNQKVLDKLVEPLREKLKGYQELKYTPVTPSSPEEILAKVADKEAAYKPIILKGIADITEIPLEAIAGDGKATKLNSFALAPEFIAESAERMTKLFASQGIEVNENSLPHLRATVINDAILRNQGKIFHAIRDQARQEMALEYDIKLDNPSAFNSNGSGETPQSKATGSFENQLFED